MLYLTELVNHLNYMTLTTILCEQEIFILANITKSSREHITKKNKYKVGIVLISVFSVILLLLALQIFPFFSNFILGLFGLLSYVICLGGIAVGTMMVLNKQVFLEKFEIAFMLIWLVVFVAMLHLATSLQFLGGQFSTYLANTYALKSTVGGVLFSLLVYPLHYLTHTVASFTLLSILLVALTTVIIDKLYANRQFKKLNTSVKYDLKEKEATQPSKAEALVQEEEEEEVIISDEKFAEQALSAKPQEEKNKAKIMLGLSEKEKEQTKNILQNSKNATDFGFKNAQQQGMNRKDYILTPKLPNEKPANLMHMEEEFEVANKQNRPPKIVHQDFGVKQRPNEITEQQKRELSDSDKKNLEFLRSSLGGDLKKRKEEVVAAATTPNKKPQLSVFDDVDELLNQNGLYDDSITQKNYQKTFNKPQNLQPSVTKPVSPTNFISMEEEPIAPVFDVEVEQETDKYNEINRFGKSDFVRPVVEQEKPHKPKTNVPYVKPTIDLLKVYEPNMEDVVEDYTQKAQMLEQTLSSFKIPASVVSVTKGPAFTRFELQMPTGIPVKRVTGYIDDIAMILESQGAVRIEIPIPGKNAFGVEVPNEHIDTVGLRDILEAYSFTGSKSLLTFALGKDITGECKVARLDKMPHLLVAGATGSGKSVCLNSLIISMLYKASPEDLRIILIDPKRVEFTLYNGLPHLLVPNVITEPDKAISALTWTIDEMERRFTLFSKYRVRNLDEFNDITEVKAGMEPKLPYLLLIVDELADLMVLNKKEIEEKIIRIAQKSRAAGIHLVLATQRPSVNVITGIIKANLPSRIAFAVTSNPDSRTILDQGGAEKLLGKGDMLYSPNDQPDPIRLQGAFISNEEVGKVVEFVKANNDADFDSDIEDKMFNKKQYGFDAEGSSTDFDPLLKDAVRNFIRSNSASISRLQRLFGIGFQRAGKIVDQLESLGYISEKDSSNNRKIFMTQQEFEEKFGEDL